MSSIRSGGRRNIKNTPIPAMSRPAAAISIAEIGQDFDGGRIGSDLLGKLTVAEVLLIEGENNLRVNQMGTTIFTLEFKAGEQVSH